MNDRSLFRVDDDYRLVSRLFLRGLALVYLVAFLSLAVQISGLAGPDGILPFGETLDGAYRELGWSAWFRLPTVFWFDASDLALQAAAYGGAVLAVLLLFGVWPTGACVGLFVLYLSLFHAGDLFLSFQWDTLLLETGFLAIFLARMGPGRLLIFMFHWLLFRLRFMSGFFKLYSGDATWSNLTALDYYFETQVLPHAGSWYFHHLPEGLHQAGVALVLFTELVVPFFIFLPRRFRIAAALITIAMQLLIMAGSNHNFVNLLVIVLCLFLLDDRFVTRFVPGWLLRRATAAADRAAGTAWNAVLAGCAALILLTSVVVFSLRTVTPNYPGFLDPAVGTVLSYGVGHIFHVYPVIQVERQELEIQGSADGTQWIPYRFRYKPGPVDQRPPVNIPHQPRLDWMMWFLPPQSRPDDFWLQLLLKRLHEGSPPVLALFESNPFPDRPPRYLRVLAYDYRFTTPAERAATGNWWVREYLGIFPYVKPRVP